MYTKGEIKIGNNMDSRNDYKETLSAGLPHSCDCWVIGGVIEIQNLIDDLVIAKEKLLKGLIE